MVRQVAAFALSMMNAGGWTLQAFAQMPRFGVMSGLGLQVLDVQRARSSMTTQSWAASRTA
jgi:hypothetical protein